jgi:hypothetical protein
MVEVLELIQKIQPSCEDLQEGMKNFVLNVVVTGIYGVFLGCLNKIESGLESETENFVESLKIKQAKEHLLLLLRVIDYIRGFKNGSILEILEKQASVY